MPPPAKIKKVENVFEGLIKAMKAPVEFDLPSALKEWKLGYYIPIKRNVYLTKRRIEDDGIFCSCTPSSGSTVACDKDCQCGMLSSCCSSNCKCDNKCANKSFQHRPLKKTKLITDIHLHCDVVTELSSSSQGSRRVEPEPQDEGSTPSFVPRKIGQPYASASLLVDLYQLVMASSDLQSLSSQVFDSDRNVALDLSGGDLWERSRKGRINSGG